MVAAETNGAGQRSILQKQPTCTRIASHCCSAATKNGERLTTVPESRRLAVGVVVAVAAQQCIRVLGGGILESYIHTVVAVAAAAVGAAIRTITSRIPTNPTTTTMAIQASSSSLALMPATNNDNRFV